MKQQIGLGIIGVALLSPARASAEGDAGPPAVSAPAAVYYIATSMSTTVATRPAMGQLGGPARDVTVSLGLGRSLASSVFAELDVSGAFVDGARSISLVPSISWSFHPELYAAMHVNVPVSPADGTAISPGLGVLHSLDEKIAIFGELDVTGTVARAPDFGASLTLGATVNL